MENTSWNSKKIFGIAGIILSILSFLLISESVGEEPFFKFKTSNALTQLVGATVIIVLWIELLGVVSYFMIRKGFNFYFLVFLIWGAFVLFWLLQVPYSYISDIVKFQNPG